LVGVFDLIVRKWRAEMKKRNIYFLFILLAAIIFLNASDLFAGSATLSWDPPTTNEDGTPLTDLAGYKIYYGTSSGNYSQSVDVGKVTTFTAGNLTEGVTYYFAATAYDISANESKYSNEVSKTIPLSQYTITVNKVGTGTGTVTSSPAGISCGPDCSEIYTAGITVTLMASSDTSSTFGGWSGGGCTGTGTCSVTMNAEKTVTATFTLKTYTITASAGTGGSISPSGNVSVSHGSSQTFSITPNTNYHIADVLIDGNSAGAVTTYSFGNVTANHTISASFAQNSYTLSVTKTGTGTGAITSSPGGISCGSDCSEIYTVGTAVTLTASSDTSSTFGGWSGGGCTGTGTCSVTMNAEKAITATFTLRIYTITATAGTGGSISPSGNVSVNNGSNQTFTITPNSGYSVVDVEVDGVSKGTLSTYTFTNVTSNHTIEASFTDINRPSPPIGVKVK
jgi:hypothetical protein